MTDRAAALRGDRPSSAPSSEARTKPRFAPVNLGLLAGGGASPPSSPGPSASAVQNTRPVGSHPSLLAASSAGLSLPGRTQSLPPSPLVTMADFKTVEELGHGAHAQIFSAMNLRTNSLVALKVTTDPSLITTAHREAEALMRCAGHENVVQIYSFFAVEQQFVLELEMVEGLDLYEYMSRRPRGQALSEDEARIFYAGLAEGLVHCQRNRICHRDVKV
jgi:serine/threonine protein kinase